MKYLFFGIIAIFLISIYILIKSFKEAPLVTEEYKNNT